MGLTNSNDINLKVGFDVDRFTAELQKTNSMLSKWGTGIQAQLTSAFSIGAGIYLLKQGVSSAVSTMAEFQKSMSEVKALTGATSSEFKALRDNALNLSGAFKAIDISKLETEYARLGFSTREILAATKTTIQLASATGEDLAKSATIAGSTLRAFNLDASQMGRVGDVMAAAFNKSALGLNDFGEAIKYVAPVAYAAGISLEQVSAMLGVLADNGIKGSMAGTSLRKIISDLGQGAAPVLNKRLEEMAAAGLSGASAMDEVGRTAYASLLILSKNTEKVIESTQAYTNSSGELKKMSDVMQDNLIGDWHKLTSEIDKSVIVAGKELNAGRDIVQYYTGLIKLLNGTSEAYDILNKKQSPLWQKVADKQTIAGENADTSGGFRANLSEILKNNLLSNNTINSVGALQDKIKDLNQLIKESGSGSQIDIYKDEIASLELQIFKLLTNAELIKAKLHIASKDNTLPSSTIQQFAVPDPGSALADSFAKVKPKIATLVEKYKGLFDGFHISTQRLGYAFVNMGSNISTGLAQAMAGTLPFAQAMGQMAMSVVDSLERMALAYMIENSAKFGIAGIAGAIAGFAGIKLLFSRIGGSGTSTSMGNVANTPRLSNSIGSQSMNIQLSGQLTAKGSDLVYIMSKQGYKAGRIGG